MYQADRTNSQNTGNISLPDAIATAGEKVALLRKLLNRSVIGRGELVDHVLLALFSRGHILLEGSHGLGKMTLLRALAGLLDWNYQRIVITPDLCPGELLDKLERPQAPRLLLIETIEQAMPKTQAALLHFMQTHPRDESPCQDQIREEPVFILASHSNAKDVGTDSLSEKCLDRFLFHLSLERSSRDDLRRIVKTQSPVQCNIAESKGSCLSDNDFFLLSELRNQIFLPETVVDFIVNLIESTHKGKSVTAESIKFGASSRAAVDLANAVRTMALFASRPEVNIEDVRKIAVPLLEHRIQIDYHARIEGQTGRGIIKNLLLELSV